MSCIHSLGKRPHTRAQVHCCTTMTPAIATPGFLCPLQGDMSKQTPLEGRSMLNLTGKSLHLTHLELDRVH
jgi:hypothetical protein